MFMIKIKKLTVDAIVPYKSREGDACYDLFTSEDYYVPPHKTVVIPTGIAIELPVEYEAEIRPRSGISLNGAVGYAIVGERVLDEKERIKCTVIQGTIDSNYRGEVGIIFKNDTIRKYIIPKHTKLAQMKINYVPDVKLVEVDELSNSNRGANGFGSSGI